jgi:hypothetical protein
MFFDKASERGLDCVFKIVCTCRELAMTDGPNRKR